jgi:hypothetical protein
VYASIVESLLVSPEPAIRWKVRSRVLGERADAPQITTLREEVRGSAVVRRLLAPFDGAQRPGTYTGEPTAGTPALERNATPTAKKLRRVLAPTVLIGHRSTAADVGWVDCTHGRCR